MSDADDRREHIRQSIIRDLNEGVIILGLDGRIDFINKAASDMLCIPEENTVGVKFARLFIAGNSNDQFIQTVLDAVYDNDVKHYNLVPYNNGTAVRQLYVMTSLLKDGEDRIGVIILISDITELAELKIEYANAITSLLDSLVKTLSTAIDERSPYTANHARNMVRIAEAFIRYLDETDDPHKFDSNSKHAFLMSTWLHDVGKLAVPLEVMDKATRLGDSIKDIDNRFERIRLLDRIALLEGKITADEWNRRNEIRENRYNEIIRLNGLGFISDEDLKSVEELSSATYIEENGEETKILNEQEILDLHVRKGTLTDDERAVIQSHVTTTRKILNQVVFPKEFNMVPFWASSHHELLNGKGYPDKLKGEEIPFEVRLLTIIDIYETLTSRDRPYKKPIPPEKSLGILRSMVDEGAIDKDVLDLFEKSGAWKAVLNSGT